MRFANRRVEMPELKPACFWFISC